MAQSHRLPSLLCLIAVAIMAHTVRAQNSPQDFLDAARDSVGVGPMSWDDGVAAYANQRRADCQLFHSGGTYDENLFKGGASRRLVGVGCVVALARSTSGCARVVCDDGGVFITCNYSPPGNYVGQRRY
ncbi:hypothetical protein OPV22_024101 [Ensete ventricosum]|uniref:SCP domain-containing protein n=1 Tax=Ensete ventricosum TaxID=4639 RepID=A0AAV8QTT0_ENSVE|nr:hypothetical protein OPV22_024101 [Ensete ventricosum]